MNSVLLSPVDGLKPSSARRFLASAFSSSDRKRDFVRSGMSGNMKKPLVELVYGVHGGRVNVQKGNWECDDGADNEQPAPALQAVVVVEICICGCLEDASDHLAEGVCNPEQGVAAA